jgi:diguanylate cyclase (GGDEF)-like protein
MAQPQGDSPGTRQLRRSLTTATTAALVLTLLSAVMLLKWWLLPSAFGQGPFGVWYAGIYIAGALGGLLCLGALRGAPSGGLPTAVAVLVLAFGVMLAWVDLHGDAEYTAFNVATFALALVYTSRPSHYAVLLATAFAVLVGLLILTIPGRLNLSDFVTQAILVGLAFTGCFFLEAQRREADHLAADLENANLQLKEASLRDMLTGLYNRRYLVEFLAGRKALVLRMEIPLSVVLIDLDHFKSVNDNWGHQVGDAVLREFAQFLLAGIREADTAVRYGGEEFLLILPQANAENAARVTQRILDRVRAAEFPGLPRMQTFSAGIAELQTGDSTEDLVARADRRLYLAKGTRNTVVWEG